MFGSEASASHNVLTVYHRPTEYIKEAPTKDRMSSTSVVDKNLSTYTHISVILEVNILAGLTPSASNAAPKPKSPPFMASTRELA